MFTFKLPNDRGDLILAPQWAGLNPTLQWALIIGLFAVPLGLVFWLYRYELRLVPRLTALSLLGLRVVGLLLIVFLVCLQPIYGRTTTFQRSGRVLIAVDRSDSMGIADRQREPAEKLRLARALKIAGDVSTADLDDWIAAHEKNREPQWVKPDEAKDDPAKRRRLTEERRKAHDELCRRVDELTRGEVARLVLDKEGLALLPALTDKHSVELLGFNREAWELKSDQMDELFRSAEGKSAGTEKEPVSSKESAFTDIRLPLARALERSGPGQGKVFGIILLTDGQHNSGEPPTAKARELGERRLPVYPIALGARKAPPDVAVSAVHAANRVFKDVEAPVEVTFKISGLPAQTFLVELSRSSQRPGEEKKVLAERIVRHDGKDRVYTETFPVRMDEVGTQTLTATVKPVNPDTKETRTDNNSRLTTVEVADDKAKVLLVDGEARWEYHYLASALKRDRTIKLTSVIFHQPRLNPDLTPAELEKMGCPLQKWPEGPHALADYDCIILGDVGPEQLPSAERVRLEKYVAEAGKTLVIVAGKRFMPLAYPEAGPDGETDPLRKLLPILSPRVAAPVDGFPMTLTAAGKETKFLEMDPDPSKSAAIWHALPRHQWGVVGEAKPAATTLAYVAEAGDEIDPPDAQKSQGLIVRQNYGFGRVLYVGMDSTWRWRYKVGDVYHHTFWGAVLRWAASDKPLMNGNEYLRFGTPQPVYSREEEVQVVVRLNEEAGPIKADLLAGARILRQGGPGEPEKAVALVPLARREAQPRVLEGRVRDLPPGSYAIELVIPDLADKLQAGPTEGAPQEKKSGTIRAHFTVRPPDSREMIDLETRWPLLEEVAAKSGGKVFTPEDAGELANLLASQSVPESERHEQRLWQWEFVLGAMLVLLTLEWVGRKLAGLP
jgi:hypothetical protein